MEMNDYDEKHVYDVYDQGTPEQEFEDPLGKRKKQAISKKGIGNAILLALILLILAVVVILQVVTVAHLNLVPVVCPDHVGTTDQALTGSNDGQNTYDSKELTTQLSQLINMTDEHTQNNAELLQQLIEGTSNDSCTTSQNACNEMLLSQMSHLISLTQEVLSSDENMTCTNNEPLQQLLEVTQDTAQRLYSIVSSLSNLENTNTASQGTINDILVVVEQLLNLQNGSLIFSSHIPISCQDIKQKQPDSPSGYYHVNSKLIYCHMGELCNSPEGGWTRLGHLDMSDSTVSCPSGFRLYETGGVRACGRPNGGPSCVSVKLPSNGISYSQVCGRVIGYQYASPDAVDTRFTSLSKHNDINTYYVDGVSITQGSPRKHIWTLMAGVRDSFPDAGNCPCNIPPGSTQQIQSFVGNDYFCESGNPNNGWTHKLYTDDPLWDGEGCGSHEGNCCSASGLPWFHKTFNTTTDYIELRECGDEATTVDDVPISFYEIYVK